MRAVVFQKKNGARIKLYPALEFTINYVLFCGLVGGLIFPGWPLSWLFGGLLTTVFYARQSIKLKKRIKVENLRILTEAESDSFKLFATLKAKFNLKKLPDIYIDSRNSELNAEARTAYFRPSLIISAGLLVEAGRKTDTATTMLAHEFAHLVNSDTFFLLLLDVVRFVPWVMLFAFVVSYLGGIVSFTLPIVIISLLAAAAGYWFIATIVRRGIWRRELYADAMAANVLTNDSGFHVLLGQDQDVRDRQDVKDRDVYMSFHPSPEERISALNNRSPLANPSIFNIAVGVYLSLATALGGVSSALTIVDLQLFGNFRTETVVTDAVIYSGVGGALFVLVGVLAAELTKPWSTPITVRWNVTSVEVPRSR